jgi:RHS repeat-associated protein
MTERVQVNSMANVSAGLADLALTSAGATGTKTSTFGASANLTTIILAIPQPPSVLFYQSDQLGSTRLLTDSAGVVRGTFSYDAFGNVVGSSGSYSTPLGWGGQYEDAESGLIYLQARSYDPATAQFLTRDPMLGTTRSPYAYVHDNPLNRADPSGLCAWDDVPCLVAQAANALLNHIVKPILSRNPDYVSADLSGSLPFAPWIQVGATVTLTRDGHIFVGPQAGVGVPGATLAVRAGWIDSAQQPSCADIDKFIEGWSLTGSGFWSLLGGVGPSASEQWGNEGKLGWKNFSTEIGVAVGAGRSLGVNQSYQWELPFSGPSW